ncbi:MAG: hypothetical protein ACI4NG_00080 [Candidatus Gallimonas sp.]
MVRYMKCPRCELNYIDAEKQEYCDICLKELKGIPTETDELEAEDEEMATELCPICGENMMRAGDKMCEECRKKTDYEEAEVDPEQDDDEWRNYLDDDSDVGLEDGEMGEIDEAFDDGFDEEEEEETVESDDDDDFDYVTGDEIYSLGDDDDDDDDDDDKKDDDDF